MTNIDPRIGTLNNGQFYAFAHGYDKPAAALKTFDVVMRFQYPAWDEIDGISFPGIRAASKAEAIKDARKEAERGGHTTTGKGRYTFTATEI